MAEKQDYRKKIENFSYGLNNRISEQSQIQIYRGLNENNDESVAIKVYSLKNNDVQLTRVAESQIEHMRRLKHPNIVSSFEIFSTKNNCYVVMEYCEGRDLESLIRRKTKIQFQETCAIFKQMLVAFQHLIKSKYFHRDLKPSNILIKDMIIKIGDFTCATFIDRNIQKTKPNLLTKKTITYRSPQFISNNKISQKSEIWSLFLIFYQMLTGKLPWEKSHDTSVYYSNIISKSKLIFPNEIPQPVRELMRNCLNVNVDKRFDTNQLFADPWVNQLLKNHIPLSFANLNQKNSDFSYHQIKMEKYIVCQFNWMKFLERISTYINQLRNFFVNPLLQFIILKQMFTQCQLIEKSLNGQNPFDFISWSTFCLNEQKIDKLKLSLEGIKLTYEKQRVILKNLIIQLQKEKKARNILNENFQLEQTLSLMGISLSIEQIKTQWKIIKEEYKGKRSEKIKQKMRLLDFLLTYYQLNCLLIDNFKRIDYFQKNSKLSLIIETEPVVEDIFDQLMQKLKQLELIDYS